jgi:hypothetical protein
MHGAPVLGKTSSSTKLVPDRFFFVAGDVPAQIFLQKARVFFSYTTRAQILLVIA